MVDDSHASGVLGSKGRGSVEGLMERVDILTSTFGKALGGAGGGFTAGRKEIINVLHQRSRTTLFSNSLPPMIANAALYVLQNYDSKFNSNREKLIENTNYFRSAMEKLGFNLGGDGKHPITPVILGEEKLAVEMAGKLFEKGIYVRGFTYPVVPKGKARIRVQISAAHTKEQMDKTVRAFEQVGKEMRIIK
jgi:glycine C-acetyltransferase